MFSNYEIYVPSEVLLLYNVGIMYASSITHSTIPHDLHTCCNVHTHTHTHTNKHTYDTNTIHEKKEQRETVSLQCRLNKNYVHEAFEMVVEGIIILLYHMRISIAKVVHYVKTHACIHTGAAN